MALPSNTFATYEAIGNREDLSDVVYRVDPTSTPFISAIETEKATGTFHEWQTQALAAVDTANAVLEGDDATTDASTANSTATRAVANCTARSLAGVLASEGVTAGEV